MKILAIRLKNLASLPGPHCIDFTIQPLARAGLFAIVGPTGAGKSTLLDALCLAFFGKTPRLRVAPARGQLPDGDNENLGINDPRTLLRRGTANGYAEVDFVGADGRRYRTRWEVRRARGRSGGRLQAVERSLLDLESNQILATQTQEHAALIEQRLGLSFDQFTRAVLLAQSEFASFLKADDKERAELLEKLTDSARFSKISLRSFARAKESEAIVRQIESESGAITPLELTARGELETNLRALKQQRLERTKFVSALQSLQGWWQTHAELDNACLKADADLAARQQDQAEREPDRALLRDIVTVAPIRDDWRALCEAQKALELSFCARDEAAEALVIAHAQRDTAEQLRAQTMKQVAAWEIEAASERTRLRQAVEWAAESALRKAAAVQRDTHIQGLALAHENAASELTDARAAVAQQQIAVDSLQASLSELEPWRALQTSWSAHRLLLNDLVNAIRRRRELNAQSAGQQSRLELAERTQTNAAQALADARLSAGQAQAALAMAADVSAHLAAAHAQLNAQTTERERVVVAIGVWQEFERAQSRLAGAQLRERTLMVDIEQAQARFALAYAASERAALALEQVSAVIARLRRARSSEVQSLREQLVPGSQCPVCGSEEHPFADAQHLLDALSVADENELQAARTNARDTVAALQAERSCADGFKARQLETRTAIEAAHAEVDERQKLLPISATDERDPESALAILTLQHTRDAVDQRLREQRVGVATLVQQQAARSQWEQACDQAAQQLNDAQSAHAAAQLEFQVADSQMRQWQADWAQSNTRIGQQQQQMDGILPAQDWPQLIEQPETTVTELARRVATIERTQAQLDEVNAARQTLQLRVDEGARVLATTQLQWQDARLAAEHLTADDLKLQAQLASLLGAHASADAWTYALDQSAKQRASTLEQSHLQLQRTHMALTHREQADTKSAADLQSAQAALARAEALIADFQHAQPALDSAALARLCAIPADQIEQVRARVSAAEASVREAATRREDRAMARQQHLARHTDLRARLHAPSTADTDEDLASMRMRLSLTPPLAQNEAQAIAVALVDCANIAEQQQAQDEELRMALRADDDCRQRLASLADRLQSARDEHQRWGQISQVIGAHDGSAFRGIAQAYNLEVLLELANAHLAELTGRYRLRRSGSDLGIFVVDGELGDTLRSVHSLSGGESFLVSLSLALALAAMSSHRLRIESLFIDEGFGVLDAQSLDIALNALDGLQALGRKVGVISHIPEMHERIGVQIQVRRSGPGTSTLEVVS